MSPMKIYFHVFFKKKKIVLPCQSSSHPSLLWDIPCWFCRTIGHFIPRRFIDPIALLISNASPTPMASYYARHGTLPARADECLPSTGANVRRSERLQRRAYINQLGKAKPTSGKEADSVEVLIQGV